MFKSAKAILAHNSTIPALAGNSEWKPLQEVIRTEKLVLQGYVHRFTPAIQTPISRLSLQRLRTDVGKSSDALRAWAGGEGEDLQVRRSNYICSTSPLTGVPRTRSPHLQPY